MQSIQPADAAQFRALIDQIKRNHPLRDVLEGAGVKFRSASGGWIVAPCPFPNHSDSSPSFKINQRRNPNSFICFGCGARGDVFDFVRDYFGKPTLDDQVRHLTGRGIFDLIGGHNEDGAAQRQALAQAAQEQERRRVEREQREAKLAPVPDDKAAPVYEALLDLLELGDAHREEILIDRGFSPDIAYALGWRSLPVSRDRRLDLCSQLSRMRFDLWRVPGFFRLPKDAGANAGKWCLGGSRLGHREISDQAKEQVWPVYGLILPTRNEQGRVVRLKIRNSSAPAEASEDIRERFWPQKYMALSTSQRTGGANAGVRVHFAGPPDGGRFPGVLWATEGEIKSDISAHLLQARFAGLPGVSQNTELLIEAAKRNGFKQIFIAMDAEQKIHVHVAISRIAVQARWEDIEPRVVIWDESHGKGLDNLLVRGQAWTTLSDTEWWQSLRDDERLSVEKRLAGSCVG